MQVEFIDKTVVSYDASCTDIFSKSSARLVAYKGSNFVDESYPKAGKVMSSCAARGELALLKDHRMFFFFFL
jgi:hypothetical protein